MRRIFIAFLFLFLCRGLCGCGEVTTENIKEEHDAGFDSGNSSGTGGQIVSSAGTGGTSVSVDSGSCLANIPNNFTCSRDCDCYSGYCPSGTCVPKPNNNGDACTKNSNCTSNWCHPDLGLCENMPVPRQPGETCNSDWECVGFCDNTRTPNLCHITLRAGGHCDRNAQCDSQMCDTSRSQCL